MQADPSQVRVVLITHPEENAQHFARRLVEAGLAACVNLHALKSVYRWEGELETSTESQLILKTHAQQLAELELFLEREHPYDVPEFIVLTPESVGRKYAAWIAEVL